MYLTVFEIIIGMENVSLVGTSPLTAVDPDSRLPVLPLNTRSSAIAEGPRDASCQLNSCLVCCLSRLSLRPEYQTT